MTSLVRQVRSEFTKLNDDVTDDVKLTKLSKELELTSPAARNANTPVVPGMEDIILPSQSARLRQTDALTLRQKIWRLFEEPTSSRLASLIALLVVCMIAMSVTAFIVQTLPQFIWSTDRTWSIIEITCISVFTVEFVLRLACCPSFKAFFLAPLNIVDLLALLPFYVELLLPGSGGSSSATIIRIIRLVRIFRILKVARYMPWVRVFAAAMRLSLQPLFMLVFVVMIAMTVFASGMYYLERGEWSDSQQVFVRPNGDASPFQSIPASMWWAIVTMTTVGYGDMYPITFGGKLLAAVAALCGILVIAIPVTIISTNFNSEYSAMKREREKVKARMLLLKHHFKARRAGLHAVLDEVEDLVRRNTQEFQSEVESLFEQSRQELTEEIQEIIRMAFERRRQLHLSALAAGRVQGSLTAAAVKEEVNMD